MPPTTPENLPPRRVGLLRNLGPATERQLGEIGIRTEADLRACGSAAAYVRLRFMFGRSISRNFLWAMEGALTDTDWKSLPEAIRQSLEAEIAKAGKR